ENSSENCSKNSHNFAGNFCEKSSENCPKKSPNFAVNSCENSSENCPKNSPNFAVNYCENSSENHPKNSSNFTGNFGENSSENCKKGEKSFNFAKKNDCKRLQNDPKFTAKDCKNGIFANSPPQPFADKDFILLAGLIFILMNENADKKLILALVFVLLG
ncbi:MAG TPA: hypothetical protein DER68_04590, partial [Ruminococcaceae bacterium]|nr:hypothetical protein [Oscillospiraceae bacterium]